MAIPFPVSVALTAGLVPALAAGQPAPTNIAPYVSATEVGQLIDRARSMRKPGQALVVQPIAAAAPYTVLMEYRVAATAPLVHECDSEIFFVVAGSGMMMLGGALVEPRQVHLVMTKTGEPVPDDSDRAKLARSSNWTGTGATDGRAIRLSRGDVVIVPPGTVHWFNRIDDSLAMVSLHADLAPVATPSGRQQPAGPGLPLAAARSEPISGSARSDRCPKS